MLGLAIACFFFMAAVMAVGWLWQRHRKNGGWTDVFWTFGVGASGALAALFPLEGVPIHGRQVLCAALIVAWSGRLGFYLLKRVETGQEDRRYTQLRLEWGIRSRSECFDFFRSKPLSELFSPSLFS